MAGRSIIKSSSAGPFRVTDGNASPSLAAIQPSQNDDDQGGRKHSPEDLLLAAETLSERNAGLSDDNLCLGRCRTLNP